jgi:DNA-directed RNA polymerase subunit RPC12/RpoP
MEEGVLCALCGQPFLEDYGYPLACEDCGGDGVLFKDATDAEKIANGWRLK